MQIVQSLHVPSEVMVLSRLQTSAPAPARAHARSVKLLCGGAWWRESLWWWWWCGGTGDEWRGFVAPASWYWPVGQLQPLSQASSQPSSQLLQFSVQPASHQSSQ